MANTVLWASHWRTQTPYAYLTFGSTTKPCFPTYSFLTCVLCLRGVVGTAAVARRAYPCSIHVVERRRFVSCQLLDIEAANEIIVFEYLLS